MATLWEAPEFALNIGTIYETQGRLTDALQLYRQSNGAFEQAGDKPSVASGLVNMANIAARQGLYSEAIQMEEQALELRRKVAGPPEVVQCLTNLGAIYDKRGRAGDYEKALELYNQALPDMEAAHNPQALAMLLDDFGAVYQHLKQYEQAVGYHQQALELRRKIGNEQDIVVSLVNLGGAFQNLNRLEEAEDCFHEAAQGFEKVGEQVSEPGKYGEYQTTLSKLYAHYANLKLARKRYVDLELTHKHDMEALVMVERGRARGFAWQAAQNAVTLESRLRPDELTRKRELEAALTQARAHWNETRQAPIPDNAAERKVWQSRLNAAKHAADIAEDKWQMWRSAYLARNPEYRRISGQAPPDAEALQRFARRNPDTLFLEWQVLDENEILLFALSQGELQTFRLLIKAADLQSHVAAWNRAIGDSSSNNLQWQTAQAAEKKEAAALYHVLFDPLEMAGLLKFNHFKRLVLVADDVLLQIPFAALIGANGKRLIERYPLSHGISLGSLTWPTDTTSAKQNLLCIADPLGDGPKLVSRTRGEFGALGGARQESKALKILLPTTKTLIGAQARESQVKHEMPNYAILHFATHGDLDQTNPLRSALILALEPAGGKEDGLLEAREIAGMQLSARLVVLSACQTGKGRVSGGEGLLGLTWAFRAAGCPSIVASQWEVDDTVTANFMQAFYRALFAGKRKDEALQTAMRTVMEDKAHRSPYYWAAFQLIGDSAPLNLNNLGGNR